MEKDNERILGSGEFGISLAETARHLGVPTSTISKIVRKYVDDKCI